MNVETPQTAATQSELEIRIEKLRNLVRYHQHRYYILDDPELSDAAFDALFDELVKLETEHPELASKDSPTVRVDRKSVV